LDCSCGGGADVSGWRRTLRPQASLGFIDALHCCLAVVPAAALLLVLAYVIQHAKLASVIPILATGVLALSTPVFDIALGLALMGAIAGPALREWKDKKSLQKSTMAHGGEDDQ
jgi:hypothetical protein